MTLSQEEIARALSTTVEEVELFEIGAMRISAKRIFVLTRLLDVAPSFFFEGLGLDRH